MKNLSLRTIYRKRMHSFFDFFKCNKIAIPHIIKILVTSIATIILSALIGIILFFCVSRIPANLMYENVKESSDILYNEGVSWELLKGIGGNTVDNYCNGLFINIAYTSAGSFHDTFLGANTVDGENPMESLYNYMNGSVDTHIYNYARYWHGYLIFLKPLLCFGSIQSIRALNLVIQFFLVITIIVLLSIRRKLKHLIPFIALWFSLSPIVITYCLQYSGVWYITLLAYIFILIYFESIDINRLWFIFLIVGILIAFFDVFSYPLVSLAVPLIWFFALDVDNTKSMFYRMHECFVCSLSWVFGYSGMWVSKWILSSLYSGGNIIADAVNQARFRISHSYSECSYTWSSTIVNNFYEFNNQLVRLIAVFSIVILVVCYIKTREKIRIQVELIILLISFYPFIWYGIVMNHSSIHNWMTYRLLGITLFALMTMAFLPTEINICGGK